MSKNARITIVGIYVILGLLNLGVCFIGTISGMTFLNFAIGAYMLFRAKQESEKLNEN